MGMHLHATRMIAAPKQHGARAADHFMDAWAIPNIESRRDAAMQSLIPCARDLCGTAQYQRMDKANVEQFSNCTHLEMESTSSITISRHAASGCDSLVRRGTKAISTEPLRGNGTNLICCRLQRPAVDSSVHQNQTTEAIGVAIAGHAAPTHSTAA